jgi:hypothetical protein
MVRALNAQNLDAIDYSVSAICVETCPDNPEDPVSCQLTSEVTSQNFCSKVVDPNDPTTLDGHVGYGTFPVAGRICVPNVRELPPEVEEKLNALEFTVLEEAFEDIQDSANIFWYSIGTCIVVAAIYNIFLHYFAGPIIWLGILATFTALLVGGIMLADYHERRFAGLEDQGTLGALISYAVYVLYVLSGIFALMVLCFYKSIKISVKVLETSAAVVLRNLYVAVIPLISATLSLAFVLVWIFGFLYVLSLANIE